MFRRVPTVAILAALVFSGLLSSTVSADTALPLPDTMAAVGDSISQAASTGGSLGADYPQNSWSTGTNSTVNSHYLRLLALGAPISGQNNNLSVSGAKAAALNDQMWNVVALEPQPDYLTVQIGGNDLCTDTFDAMTSVDDFRAQFQTAMGTVTSNSPGTSIYVVSIPDAYQLWSLFHNNWWARFIWSAGGVCQSLLANPTSTLQVDVQRRLDVRQRNIDYNTQLAEVCAAFAKCRFDNNAVFNTQFTTSDIAGDYFHPSIAGQAKLSSVSWAAGYAWATSPPPPNAAPTASFTTSCTGLTCTFTDASTDSDGSIAGRSWTFGDGSPESTATNPSHTYTVDGTYNVALNVTDNDGATGTTTSAVTVTSPPAAQQMWVGGLTATTAPAGRSGWTATVRISVVGPGPIAGVSVAGSWSAGTGATTCTTGSDGTCTVTSSSLSKKSTPSVTFTVSGLTKSGWEYAPAKNLVSTSITVSRR